MSKRKKGRASPDLELCARVARTCPAIALGATTRRVERMFEEGFEELSIGGRQFSLLVAVSLLGPSPIARIAEATGLSPTTLSRALAVLERDGLVRSERGADRRERLMSLSAAGRAELCRALLKWTEVMGALEASVGAGKLAALQRSLRSLRADLDRDDDPAPTR